MMRHPHIVELAIITRWFCVLLLFWPQVLSAKLPSDLQSLAPVADRPIVGILAPAPGTIEPGLNDVPQPAPFSLIRSGDAKDPLLVYIEFSGSAQPGKDYVPLSQFVEIPAGMISFNFKLIPLNDGVAGGDKTVIASLGPWPLNRLPDYIVDLRNYQATVVIHDREQTNSPSLKDTFVHRELPSGYVRGAKLQVILRANPAPGWGAYAVEDQAPPGWTITEMSDDGLVDPVSKLAKFGPFTDGQSRVLKYSVLPPANDSGRHEFHGMAAVDTETFPIGGGQFIDPVDQRHPADTNPMDNSISIVELTAYATAWKEGASWPQGPLPIPASYVARAGILWKGGEAYRFDPTAGAPPLCWVNVATKPGSMGTKSEARRESAKQLQPGEAATIHLKVKPAPGVTAYTIEKNDPGGWKVLAPNEDGTIAASGSSVRWGHFFGEAPRDLTYRVVPPPRVSSSGVFTGNASFDGADQTVGGVVMIGAANDSTVMRIRSPDRLSGNRARLQLTGSPGQRCLLEGSSDFVHWFELSRVVIGAGGLEFFDADVTSAGSQFYRLRVPALP